MSRAEQRRQKREGKAGDARRSKMHPAWIPVMFVAAAFLLLGVISQLYDTGLHPEVRAAEAMPQLMPPERYAQYVRAERTYQMAAEIPQVIDGLYCHCQCREHSGHYSLLDCFASDHAAACDVCMQEAEIAYEIVAQGGSLSDVRAEIDRVYGT